MIETAKYFFRSDPHRKRHEIRFSPGLNVVAEPIKSGATTIIDAIKNKIIEQEKATERCNVIFLRDYKLITFLDDGNYAFRDSGAIKQLFADFNIRGNAVSRVIEKFNHYINHIQKSKAQYVNSKYPGSNEAVCDETFDCIVRPSGYWCIKQKNTGKDVSNEFDSLRKELTMSLALNLAVRDLSSYKPPLVIDSYFRWLDGASFHAVWALIAQRTEQVIVSDYPFIWDRLNVTPTHVLHSEVEGFPRPGKPVEPGVIYKQAASHDVQQRLDAAYADYGRCEFRSAFRKFYRLASQGNGRAQYVLGGMYSRGVHVKTNHSKALKWYRRAAENNLAVAQYELGLMYYEGDCRPPDLAEAVYWFSRAAQQGEPYALYTLGQLYSAGIWFKQDDTEAEKMYRHSAQIGCVSALHQLGLIYATGSGVERSLVKAYKWFRLAVLLGDEAAMADLEKAQAEMDVVSISESSNQVLEWFRDRGWWCCCEPYADKRIR